MPLPVVLLGNKCDLDSAEIDKNQVDRFVEEKGFVGWFDTSAKLNINIDKAARFLVDKILAHEDIFQKKKAVEVSVCWRQRQSGEILFIIGLIQSLACALLQGTFQPGVGTKPPKSSGCC